MTTIRRTLVLLKPDAVQRAVLGEILTRFEKAGLKPVGMKMVWADREHAMKHYTEEIAIRRSEFVRNKLLKSLTSGPVVAICFEGVDAVEVVRKIAGTTEPKTALPGTIRGDYGHVSYGHADATEIAIPNVVHASANKEEAGTEVALWFKPDELHTYKNVHDAYTI